MLNDWFAFNDFVRGANDVIFLRLCKFARAEDDALVEASLMVEEKIKAGFEAAAILMSGGTQTDVYERYRGYVAANSARLHAA